MSEHVRTDTHLRDAEEPPFPNALPRPPGEFEALERAWKPPGGIRILSAINNNYIGLWYIGAALLFFVLAGILAMIMRTQLAVPENTLVGHKLYNQLFTMHGTVMMFLFAVPVVEAVGVFLLPNMQAARDLPFPRLSAYAFWAYFVGGLSFFGSLFFGLAPDGGWFMYPPLTSYVYSPGINADFYLLGIGFIEISAIAGALEIIVGVMKTRAPGQTLDKLPVYSWAMLVFAGMIIIAFPAVILATLLLEIERAFHWPFFIADKGGDPLLWQHLFWFFGHPEVYIIFLPAAGMVSMIVPTMAQTPLAGYRLVVLALLATGFLSFGLWVHHMFATGLPSLSLGFFAGASMAVAIPSGIQIFAWIATIASGKLQMTTPTYFILGFLFIFTLGGLTGVMVAMVPFDWQAHDTYFIVAHLHYVLIGGMVFPLFAGFYYWAPLTSRRPLSETLGKTAFWLMFIGTNVTFFTMHITGLMGMPRRVYTYREELDWGTLNLISTLGGYMIAAGVLVFIIDVAKNFRFSFDVTAGNIWNGGTLEWLPTGTFQSRSIPHITSREPLWDQPNLSQNVEAGRYYLPGTLTGGRETIVTSPIDAHPQYILQIPRPSFTPFLAAIFTAAFFFGLTVKFYMVSAVCAVIAIASMLRWAWDLDPGPTRPPGDIGGGIMLPVCATGSITHAWWATATLVVAAASLFTCLIFSYLYLWLVNENAWPLPGTPLRELAWPATVAALYALSSALIFVASRRLARVFAGRSYLVALILLMAIPAFVGGVALDAYGFWSSGLRPDQHSFNSITYTFPAAQAFYAFVLIIMALYTIVRALTGRLNASRRVTFDNLLLLWHYSVAQGIIGLCVTDLFPRLPV